MATIENQSNGNAAAVWKHLIPKVKGMLITERCIRNLLWRSLEGHKCSTLLLESLFVNVEIIMTGLSL